MLNSVLSIQILTKIFGAYLKEYAYYKIQQYSDQKKNYIVNPYFQCTFCNAYLESGGHILPSIFLTLFKAQLLYENNGGWFVPFPYFVFSPRNNNNLRFFAFIFAHRNNEITTKLSEITK